MIRYSVMIALLCSLWLTTKFDVALARPNTGSNPDLAPSVTTKNGSAKTDNAANNQQSLKPQIRHNTSATDTFGGPDGFGYRWMDNREPGGPTFNWVDIQATGTSANITGDDPTSALLPIGFNFPFYGRTYTQFTVSVDGFISFSSNVANLPGTNGGYFYQNIPLPTPPRANFYNDTTTAPLMVCAFWTDLYINSVNNIKYQNVGGNLVVQWIYNTFYQNIGRLAFEVILSPNGTIKFQYDTLIVGTGTLASATIGIQDSTGTNGLQICYRANPNNLIAEGRAFLIYQLGPATNPTPVNGATGVPTNTSLSWSAAPGAMRYNVLFGTANPCTTVVSRRQPGLTYAPTLAASTTYYWKVIALGDTAGVSTAPGPQWSFTTGTGIAPAAPSNGGISTTIPPTRNAITLTWTDNSNDETGFPIYKMGVSDTGFIYVATAAANATSYTVNGLSPGNRYDFRIYSANATATSINFASATGWTNPTTAGTPNLAIAGTGYTSIQVSSLSADANSALCTYRIRETTTNRWITNAGTLDTTTANIRLVARSSWNNFVVNGLTSGQTYIFAATAVNGVGIAGGEGPGASITTNDMNHGGPDAYGYRYITSNAVTGGPVYSWITPSTTATTVTGWSSTDDGSAGPFNIGFPFSFYGRSYTTWYAGTNGRIQFGSANAYNYTTAVFPFATYPAGIYFWNYDMTVSNTVVQYENLTNPTRFVVTYTGLAYLGNAAQTINAQVILYPDGHFIVNYGTFAATPPPFASSAIQDTSGLRGFLQYGPPTPTATTAFLFYTLGQATDPIPVNNATNVATNTTLAWSPGMAARAYDVLFGTVNPPVTTVSRHQTGLTYTPTLAATTTYYWKVVALSDTAGTTTNPGPVWTFTTGTGASPNAPSNGLINPVTDADTSRLTVHWTSNSGGNESRFIIFRSTDGTNFTRFDSVATGVTQYTNTGLSINTHYWYQVYSFGNGMMSTNFASVDGYTLAKVPGRPVLNGAAVHGMFVNWGTTVTNGNPANTQYAIHVANSSQYVQTTGSLDTFIVWRTVAQWGDPTILRNLISSTLYRFEIKARNGSNVETAFGLSDTLSTNNGLVGNKTIGGTNPDFATISAAMAAANMGVGSPGVTFLIRGGTYNENPIIFTDSTLSGPNSTITFKPADTLGVTINVAGTSTNPFAFRFYNSDYVTFDGGLAAYPGRRFITVNATGTYGYYGFWFTNGSDFCCVKNCVVTVANNTSSSYIPIRAYTNTAQTPNAVCVSDSLINNRIVGGYYGMYLYGYYPNQTAWTNWYIADNQVLDFYYYGIYLYYFANSMIHGNEIFRTSAALTTNYGIYSGNSLNVNNVYDANWIHDMIPTATGTIVGMYLYYGPGQLISNNMIDFSPNTGGYFYGIYLYSDRAKVINNTIHIGGNNGTSGYNTIGIYMGSTTTQDTIANNIIVNERTGGTTAYYNVCIYNAGVYSANSFAYSDYNLLTTVDESTTDNRYVVRYGANSYNTLPDLLQLAGYNWDTHSISIPPNFVAVPNLHINPNVATPVESNATPFSMVPRDFDGDVRNATRPDIGCDEGNFRTGNDLFPPRVTFARLGTWGQATPRPISAIITDNIGIPTDTARAPRIWYRRSNDTTWNARRADSTRDTTYYFTIPAFPLGSTVYYYLAAQDTAGNVGSVPFGAGGVRPPGSIPPPNPTYYFVQTLLTGTKTIGGTNPDYPNLSTAVTAVNLVGVGVGGVTFRIRNGNYTETPVVLTAPLDATRPVIFGVDSGATVVYTISPVGNTAGLVFKTSYVTFDGSWPGDVDGKHLSIIGSNNLYTAAWFSDSSSYCTIKNCILDVGIQTSSSFYPVRFGNAGTPPEITIVGNRLLHCDVNGGYYGVYHYGGSTEYVDSTQIQYCNIKNFYYYGMFFYYSRGLNISHNHVYHTTASTSSYIYCIYPSSSVTGSLFDANQVGPILNATTGYVYGLYAVNAGGNVYTNNMVSLGAAQSGGIYGIYSGSLGNKFLFNTVNITGTTTSNYSVAYYNSNTTSSDTLFANILSNSRTGGAVGTYYHTCYYVASATSVAFSNYNLLYCGGDVTTDNNYIGRINTTNYNTWTDWTTSPWGPKDLLSYSEAAPFISDSNLHIRNDMATVVESGAPHHWLVNSDFDGQARTNAMWDIGADEGTFRSLSFGSLAGVVRDSIAARTPLFGVNVVAGRYSTITDSLGRFAMDMRSGTYYVRFSKHCYTTDSIMLVIDTSRVDTSYWMMHPDATPNRTSIEMLSRPGETHSTTLELRNTGNAILNWNARVVCNPHQFSVRGGGGTGSEQLPVQFKVGSRPANSAGKFIELPATDGVSGNPGKISTLMGLATDELDTSGGPDSFGYRFMDSREVNGPTFSWIAPSAAATQVPDAAWSSPDDGYAGPYNIGFTFNFYGIDYTQFYPGTNGRIQFGSGNGSYYYVTTFPINPCPAGVYFWNRDMHVGYAPNTVVRYETLANPTRCVITYDSLSVYGSGGAIRISAQVVLYQSGQVLCQYRNYVGAPTVNCVGIQNLNGTTYLAYAINGNPMPAAGSAILFYQRPLVPPFITINPMTGSALPQQLSEIFVQATIDSNATIPATWTGAIYITSNACPDTITVPVSITIDSLNSVAQTALPFEYKLYQNFPNPFNPTTDIRFDLQKAGATRLIVYNALGQRVTTLVNDYLPAGYHSVKFRSNSLATGVYFYRLESGSFTALKKMVLVK